VGYRFWFIRRIVEKRWMQRGVNDWSLHQWSLKWVLQLWGERGRVMRLAYVVAVLLIAAAPFVGRWRANVWLKKHMQSRTPVETASAVETAI
jgi:ABC-type spermidine/putrescine transport system permease subunit II